MKLSDFYEDLTDFHPLGTLYTLYHLKRGAKPSETAIKSASPNH